MSKNRGFTVFIIPESGGIPSVQLRLSYGMLLSVFLIGILSVVGTSYLVWDVSSDSQANNLLNENLRLSRQQHDLRHDISELERKFDLLLIYAAKSSWPQPTGGDVERPWIEDKEHWKSRLSMIRQKAEVITPILLKRVEKAEQVQAQFSSIPREWPLQGYITSKFGYRRSPVNKRWLFHHGIDIAAPYGRAIYAPLDGKVVFAKTDHGYGKSIILDHGHGIKTRYAHSSRLLVKKGQQVKKGQTIAYVGSTGQSTGPHLHYEVRIDGVAVDPLMYLPY